MNTSPPPRPVTHLDWIVFGGVVTFMAILVNLLN